MTLPRTYCADEMLQLIDLLVEENELSAADARCMTQLALLLKHFERRPGANLAAEAQQCFREIRTVAVALEKHAAAQKMSRARSTLTDAE